MTDVLLTLSTRPQQAEAIADWLLEQNLPGFTSWQAFGHSNRNEQLSLSEQIQGKQKRTVISLHLPPQRADTLLQQLAAAFPQYDIHYWLQPLLACGALNPYLSTAE
ncbi:MAG: DUF3240 family protein [Gammaproteobacteria bacterium]|jgi:hypothetical protein|nr:DUF3240 family protein [Gammaproteobacteria bacterium]